MRRPGDERGRGWWVSLLILLLCCLCGCASPRPHGPAASRKFNFAQDTFAYANELVWEYGYDAKGHWTTHRREPKPDYALHCFVVARSADQFFENARFAPREPRVDLAGYRRLVQRVVATDPRKPVPLDQRIVIPGYADLRAFSRDHEPLLKAECGGAWQCYFQRGNWRMIFPFSRREQARTAQNIRSRLLEGHPVLVHLVRFPQLTINHTILIFDATEHEGSIQFTAYDPNTPQAPLSLSFDRASNTFRLPSGSYFRGGRVDLYEICHRWDY